MVKFLFFCFLLICVGADDCRANNDTGCSSTLEPLIHSSAKEILDNLDYDKESIFFAEVIRLNNFNYESYMAKYHIKFVVLFGPKNGSGSYFGTLFGTKKAINSFMKASHPTDFSFKAIASYDKTGIAELMKNK